MYKYRFSIFTSTYNRARYLPVVYECLKRQTYQNFEWVIVNDGSSDNTDEVCKSFINEGLLHIKYIRKNNGGKHTAWRIATKVFEGRYVLGADDDDVIPNNAIEIFEKHWRELENLTNYDEFWEIRACVQLEDGLINTPPLPSDPYDSDYNEVNYKLGLGTAEMQSCRKVEVLRNEAAVPDNFIFENYCSNFPECIRWSRAARKYKTRFIRDVVRIYIHRDGEALCSSNKGAKRSYRRTFNSVVGEIYVLNEQRDLLLQYAVIRYFKTIFLLSYHQLCLRMIVVEYLNHVVDKIFVFCLIPIALVLYLIRER